MRRLVVAILVAISVGLACSAATKTFTNTTGQAATQIVVTFSEEVRITSYDKSVFPSQSPSSGEAESFTFSGGTLDAGGTFRVTWSPSSARVTSSTWVAGLPNVAQGAASAGTQRRGVFARLELLGHRDVQVLAREWNVNLLRLGVGIMGARGIFSTLFSKTPGDPVALPEDFARLDEVLDECAAVGIAVIIDLHQTAGYEYVWSPDVPRDFTLWNSEALQQRLVNFWETVAQHCAGRGKEVYAYELLNEPYQDGGIWNRLAKRVTQAIRVYDQVHPIIVDSTDWANPATFSSLVPTQDSSTIYSFHLYKPNEFASQGWYGYPVGTKYPTREWNEAFLEKQIQPVLDFQKKWRVPIFIGEFGASYYADPESRAAYHDDCMSLFEEKGFDYCYSEYRGSPEWSLEHDRYEAEWGLMPKYVGSTPALDAVLQHFAADSPSGVSEVQTSPKCLFDEAHWPSGSRQFDRDRNVMSEQLAFRLSSYCDVSIHASDAISSEDLKGIGLLVLGRVTSPLSAGEIAAIESFVTSGGSLLAYADVGVPMSVNSLLGRFGIRFDNRLVVSSDYDWDPPSFWVPFAPIAGVFENGGAYHTNWGGSLTVTPPARSILATDANAWIDVDGNQKRSSADIAGPVTLAAIAEVGTGRIAVLADNPFADSRPIYFVLEVVRWLLRL